MRAERHRPHTFLIDFLIDIVASSSYICCGHRNCLLLETTHCLWLGHGVCLKINIFVTQDLHRTVFGTVLCLPVHQGVFDLSQ